MLKRPAFRAREHEARPGARCRRRAQRAGLPQSLVNGAESRESPVVVGGSMVFCLENEEPCRPQRSNMVHFQASEVQQLLHNKFVVILGDSIQRAVYKDLVLLLQKDSLLTAAQLKAKVWPLLDGELPREPGASVRAHGPGVARFLPAGVEHGNAPRRACHWGFPPA